MPMADAHGPMPMTHGTMPYDLCPMPMPMPMAYVHDHDLPWLMAHAQRMAHGPWPCQMPMAHGP